MQLDLVSFVEEPTWKDLLLNLVNENNLNPWDMDISKVAEEYLKLIKEMELLDLRIPANVLLASAILYRFKSEGVKHIEEPVIEDSFDERVLIQEDIPELVYKENQARKRGLTLEELVTALESVIKNPPKKTLRPLPTQITLAPPEEEMGERMKKLFEKIDANKDGEGLVLFSKIVDKDRFISHSMLPMLHLVQDKKIHVWQEKLFDEIFISTKIPQENTDEVIVEESKNKRGRAIEVQNN